MLGYTECSVARSHVLFPNINFDRGPLGVVVTRSDDVWIDLLPGKYSEQALLECNAITLLPNN
jgi:hypothetical protein